MPSSASSCSGCSPSLSESDISSIKGSICSCLLSSIAVSSTSATATSTAALKASTSLETSEFDDCDILNVSTFCFIMTLAVLLAIAAANSAVSVLCVDRLRFSSTSNHSLASASSDPLSMAAPASTVTVDDASSVLPCRSRAVTVNRHSPSGRGTVSDWATDRAYNTSASELLLSTAWYLKLYVSGQWVASQPAVVIVKAVVSAVPTRGTTLTAPPDGANGTWMRA